MNVRMPLVAYATLVVLTAPGLNTRAADDTSPRLTLAQYRKIGAEAGHSAFTGLVRHGEKWFCVFREGSAHIPGTDGVIRVLTSDDARNWSSAAVVKEAGVDLRDPKIDVTPDGRLMLLMGGSVYAGENGRPDRAFVRARSKVAFSSDGHDWTAPRPVSVTDQWLWRVTWHGSVGYGFAYKLDAKAEASEFTLWKTADGVSYERVADPKLPGGVRPDETTVRFLPDGSMLALVRNEGRGGHAYLGTSRAPFTEWTWSDAGHAAHGPDLIVLPDGVKVYAGRDFPDGARTVVGVVDGNRLVPRLTLPSGGDTSYPGLVWHDGRLFVSYYASHEGKTSVYLAEVRVGRP